jgi:hypothetical protein
MAAAPGQERIPHDDPIIQVGDSTEIVADWDYGQMSVDKFEFILSSHWRLVSGANSTAMPSGPGINDKGEKEPFRFVIEAAQPGWATLYDIRTYEDGREHSCFLGLDFWIEEPQE